MAADSSAGAVALREQPSVKPLALHEAERNLIRQRRLTFAAAAGRAPAELRCLPFPFARYCTIASDADGATLEGLEAVGQIVRGHYGLPIADSIIPHFLFNHGFAGATNREAGTPTELYDRPTDENFDLGRFVATNFDWLRRFHQGWTDTIHGWLLRIQIRIGDDVVLQEAAADGGAGPRGLMRRTKRLSARLKRYISRRVGADPTRHDYRRRLNFHLPSGWHRRVAPRYMVFRYCNPTRRNQATLVFLDGAREVGAVNLADVAAGAPLTLQTYVIDLHKVVGTDSDLLKRIDAELRVTDWTAACELRDPVLTSWLRSDIAEQVVLFDQLNLGVTAYTSHGGGFNIGQSIRVGEASSADARGMAENPAAAHYALDIFRHHGFEFFNTADNTSQGELKDIGELVVPRVINNGELVYDFHRYLHIPKRADGGDDMAALSTHGAEGNASFSNFAGGQIASVLDRVDAPGRGAIIYTHLLTKAPLHPDRDDVSVARIFDQETHDGLNRLAGSYYGIRGGAGAPGHRVFVAPTATLLRYSQVIRELPHHAFHAADTDTIHVESWTDPVTGKRVPDQGDVGRQLRFATFYVKNAASARVLLDGEPLHALIRNPADETGRQSVTIADVGTPTVVARSIFLGARRDLTLSGDHVEWSCPDTGPGTLLKLREPRGVLGIAPAALKLADHYYVHLRLSEAGSLRVRLDIECDDGLTLGAAEPGHPAGNNAIVVPRGPDEDVLIWVLPFHRLLQGMPEKDRRFPVSKIKRIDLDLAGPAGSVCRLAELSLVRDDDRPVKTGRVLGGSVPADSGVTEVVARCDNREYSAPVLAGGKYVFLEKFPVGQVIEVFGRKRSGAVVHPIVGRHVEVARDALDVDFA